MRRLVPGSALTSLVSGLGRTIDWFLTEKDKVILVSH